MENFDNEYWRDIEGCEGYQVSNLGRVRSLDRTVKCSNGSLRFQKGKILAMNFTKFDYYGVQFGGKNRNVKFLVAKAFFPDSYNIIDVKHKDGDIRNNCVENLECIRNEGKGNIDQYTLDNKFIKNHYSTSVAAKNTGIDRSLIADCCKGKIESVGGYIFRYTDDFNKE